jgi:hypothetical protein
MGKLLDQLKAARQKNLAARQEGRAKTLATRQKAQAAYDAAYEQGAISAVKARAKREAHDRYGYSAAERRGRAVQRFSQEMGNFGNFGGFGESSRPRARTKAKGKKRSAPRKRQSDPFDFDLGF